MSVRRWARSRSVWSSSSTRAPAALLGGVHRDVRVAEHRLGVGETAFDAGHADAGGDDDVAAGRHRDRLGDDVGDLVGPTPGRLDVGEVRAQDDELVAGEAGHRVDRAGRAAAAGAAIALQHLVTDEVTLRVVDDLEAVEVDEEHADARAGAARVVERLAQALDEHRTVGADR